MPPACRVLQIFINTLSRLFPVTQTSVPEYLDLITIVRQVAVSYKVVHVQGVAGS